VLLATVGLVVTESLLLAFGSRESVEATVANPWRLSPVTSLLDVVEPVVWVSMPMLAVLGIASLLHRIVVSPGPERLAPITLAVTAAVGVAVLLGTGTGLVLGTLLPLVVAGGVAQQLHGQLANQLALATAQTAELRASRARVTQAHDNARRRIERDLHDGAQQGLLALSMELGRLAGRVEATERREVERLKEVAQHTLAELRRLAAGTYPSALRELGVGPALREAVGHDVTLREEFGNRPQEETEAALYFACLEAVANARKHADAFTISVVLDRTDDGGYRFTVTDNGTGLQRGSGGTGLDGMADRLGARGGTLTIDSAPGRGTTVTGVAYDAPR
jgi:signal transduction histidine kinase